MILAPHEFVTLDTPYGPMRTHIVRPAAPGKYPGLVFYSEIFQITEPIRRTAALLAGHGYVVAMPEIYHEFLPAGEVLAYDQAGSDVGNKYKYEKELASYDADTRAVLDHLKSREDCTGQLGAIGICLGGHLSFRAAMEPDVRATVCFYGTDIHKGSLGKGQSDDSLARAAEIKGELLMIWGRQDPHIPLEGRRIVLARLDELNLRFAWHEVNGAHAFMRDEGARYDPELAMHLYRETLDLFHRSLGAGDR
ncbi:dienelactone hydrolase-like enzyme [Terriglobus roseus DSM 18391]|uniref:Dienelactone hydrolase-like enzyme n=1 Tax=Terriglobus roseus (strain DSM 18391 / NRRL B-41598 / KBS 63) TaxID=926566 RepID=I3ZFY6_TERRK|nr:dienelactone hydrolase family protein [Terriglobus roseus]AFL88154.1 dienelactone hydrolase-like enzyme [Terriglobus roseus DSM 18391]